MLSLKKLCFLLIPFMLLMSTPVSADQASDLAAAITENPANAEALLIAALATTSDPNVMATLAVAAVNAASALGDTTLATQLVSKLTKVAVAHAPNQAAAEKILQAVVAAVAAKPSLVTDIILAITTLTTSEANVNITETVYEIIIASVKAGLITPAQAHQLALNFFGNTKEGNEIVEQIEKSVSGV